MPPNICKLLPLYTQSQRNINLRLFQYLSILFHGLRRLCGGVDSDYKANLSPAKLGLRLSLAIKEGSKCLLNIYKLFPLYPHFKNVQFEAISLLAHTFSQVIW